MLIPNRCWWVSGGSWLHSPPLARPPTLNLHPLPEHRVLSCRSGSGHAAQTRRLPPVCTSPGLPSSVRLLPPQGSAVLRKGARASRPFPLGLTQALPRRHSREQKRSYCCESRWGSAQHPSPGSGPVDLPPALPELRCVLSLTLCIPTRRLGPQQGPQSPPPHPQPHRPTPFTELCRAHAAVEGGLH